MAKPSEEIMALHRECDALDVRWARARDSLVGIGATADNLRALWDRLNMDPAYREVRAAELRIAVDRDSKEALHAFRDALLLWRVQVKFAEDYIADLVKVVLGAYTADLAANEGAHVSQGGDA